MIGIPSGWEDAAAKAWAPVGPCVSRIIKLEMILFGRGFKSDARDWMVIE